MKEPYIVLDIETTGLSKHHHKITEIAAIKVENNKIKNRFETLINPQTNIPSFITRLTGISNKMVKDSPTISEVMPKFTSFLSDMPIIAHCASFDYGFLNHNSVLHLSKELTNNKICTRKLSRRLIPELRSYKLSCLCDHFKIKNELAHRAMPDAEVTHQIFSGLTNLMQKKGIEKISDIIGFQDSKISKMNNS
jgi:DNA polymerase-3 subunit alpha (Gram-positive type)